MKIIETRNVEVHLAETEQFDVQVGDGAGRTTTVRVHELKRYIYPAMNGGYGHVEHGRGRTVLKNGQLGKRDRPVQFITPKDLAAIPPKVQHKLTEIGFWDEVEVTP